MAATGNVNSGIMSSVNLIMLGKQMDQMQVEGAQMAEMVKETQPNIVTATKLDVRV